MPAKVPVVATMNVEPTPIAAICASTSSGRNGGRNSHATVSTANRSILPKSSSAARSRPIEAAFSHGALRRARIACWSRRYPPT